MTSFLDVLERIKAKNDERRAAGFPDPEVEPEPMPKGWRGFGIARITSHRRANGCAYWEWFGVANGVWAKYPKPFTNDWDEAAALIPDVDPTGSARVAGVCRKLDPAAVATQSVRQF